MLTLIAACDRNMAIGRKGTMPWHLPEDLAFFRRTTTGATVLMGRRTWDSLPVRPLPLRFNMVITRGRRRQQDGASFMPLDVAVKKIVNHPDEDVFCIGGGEIYGKLLRYADRIILSRIDIEAEDPDTFFPHFDPEDWTQVREEVLRVDGPRCVAREFRRSR